MDALDVSHATAFTSHRIEVRDGTTADTQGLPLGTGEIVR
jgi:hypothetical protein